MFIFTAILAGCICTVGKLSDMASLVFGHPSFPTNGETSGQRPAAPVSVSVPKTTGANSHTLHGHRWQFHRARMVRLKSCYLENPDRQHSHRNRQRQVCLLFTMLWILLAFSSTYDSLSITFMFFFCIFLCLKSDILSVVSAFNFPGASLG